MTFKKIPYTTLVCFFLLSFLVACTTSIEPDKNVLQSRAMPVQVNEISASEVLAIVNDKNTNYQIIDVRTPREYQQGYIESAVNIPHNQILESPAVLAPYLDKHLVFYCHSGQRVGRVTAVLQTNLVATVSHLTGDMLGWKAGDFPITKP